MSSELGFSANKRRLLERLLRKEGLSAQTAMTIPRRSADAVVPVSFAQQRLWFLEQLDPGNVAYNLGRGLRLTGTLDIAALEQSLNAIVARHEVLRTTFAIQDGEPIQIIAPALTVPIEQIDLTDLPAEAREAEVQRIANADFLIPFDLTTGPLIRATLLRLADDTHAFFLTNHHIVSDALSMGVIIQEFTAAYQSFSTGQPLTLAELPIQYADFSVWQRQELQGQKLEQQLDYWRQQLAGLTPLDLPTDYPRSATSNIEGALTTVQIDPSLTEQLHALSRANNVTLFMTMLAAWQVLLGRYSGQDDIAVGTATAGRSRPELERLIGFFVNTLVLRTDLSGNPTVHELIQRVRTTTLAAYGHQDVPFEAVVEAVQPERNLNYSPLFQVMFALQTDTRAALELPGLTVEPLGVEGSSARFDLTLTVIEQDTRLHVAIQYRSDLFSASTIERMAAHLQMVLAGFVANPDVRLADLELLTPAERHQLLHTWNATAVPLPPLTIPAAFAQQVARTPDALALLSADAQLTYAALDRQANALAHQLVALGVRPETRVALCLERSPDLIIAILAILKAGGCYVPLDPAYPPQRLALMLANARAAVLIARPALSAALPTTDASRLVLDPATARSEAESPPAVVTDPAQLAYVMYTSGSTGTPKGVAVPHQAVLRLIYQPNFLDLRPDDVVLHLAPAAFDAATLELWGALLTGARLVLAPPELPSLETIAQLLHTYHISVLWLTAGLFHLLVDQQLPVLVGVRRVLAGGDVLALPQVQRFLAAGGSLINGYGPTENTTFTTCYPVPAEVPLGASVPIGRPITNTTVYVLDARLQPVPVGVPGELYTGGLGLARGYLARPDLTAERFVPHPLSAIPGARLYRTGDLVRWRADGTLEFLGRRDQQVKLRGFRIELGEIEAVLQQHPQVRDALVLLRRDGGGDPRLVGYLVPEPTAAEAEAQSAHVQDWQALYDDTYGGDTPDDPTFHIVGWHSSYTGQPIPESEMREWRDVTVERIRSLGPNRVLEIGCGTGLLLFPLAAECERYHGVDFSAPALAHIQRFLPSGWTHVTLAQRRADELTDLQSGSFDTVILNSVIQYFPSVEYLLEVIQSAVAMLVPGGHIFLGDVRSRPLLDAFSAAVVLAQADPETPRAALHQQVERLIAQERELVLDPGFFHALRQQLPQISDVQVEIKRGTAHNELTQFRYDVTLTVDGPPPALPERHLDWDQHELSVDRLRALLREEEASRVLVRHIPSARVQRLVQSAALLHAEDGPATAAAIQAAASVADGVDPEALWALGQELGYAIRIGWDAGGASGHYEAVLSRTGAAYLPPPAAATPQPWAAYATAPAAALSGAALERQVRDYAQVHLPDYMVPAALVVLPAFPLTTNGKVDRAALPAPRWGQTTLDAAAAPRTPVEALLVEIWQAVLGLEQVGIHDNFFELGGHSLLATQVVSRIRTALAVELPVRALFEQPTIAALAQVIAQEQPSAALPPLQPRASTDPVPLSFAQQRLWFIEQLQPGTASYHVPAALTIEGPLDVAALRASLAAVVARHDSLRTRFVLVDATPMQQIEPQLDLPLPVIDLSALELAERETAVQQHMEQAARTPFDLQRGPLLRTILLQLAPATHVLLLTQHHIITDGWSLGILIQDLTAAYLSHRHGAPATLPPLPIQYPDYALWQREYLQGAVLEQQLGYWRQQLAGLAPLDLPTDRPRPPVQTHRGAASKVQLDLALTERLRKLSHESGTSLFMTLLTAWQVLLGRYSGQHDIAVGTPIAGRSRPELEHMIGFFVNTLVLRTDLSGNPSFVELLQQVRAMTLAAYAHQDVPFEYLVEELQPNRDMSRQPLAQVVFALQNAPLPEVTLPEIQITPLSTSSMTAKFDLTFNMIETKDGLAGSLEYATALFDPPTIERMLHHYQQLLGAIADDPAQPILKLPLLTTAEQQHLIQSINPDPRSFPNTQCLHIRFAAQAAAAPEAIAVVYADQRLTYRELDRRANQLARHLLTHGVEPGSFVGLCVERSLDVIVGVLGILKAGAAYVPLDPSAPVERLSFMLQDMQAPVLITQEHLRASLPDSSATVFCLDSDWSLIDQAAAEPVVTDVTPQHPAYVIYTSGSTGQPKGVIINHAHVDRLFLATEHWFHFDATDVWTLFHSYAFDFSVWEIWGALLYGGRLVVVPYLTSRSPEEFYKQLQAHQVTVLNQTPSAFHQLQQVRSTDDTALALRYVIFGGEALEISKLRPWFDQHGDEQPRLINMYGITETTVHVTYRPITRADLTEHVGSVIGQPIPDLPIYVLDAQLQPVPVGVVGEIYVGGAGVADGYLHRPALTAERFVPDPFSSAASTHPGARLYKSGDLARVLPGGELQYIGRADQQVKVRGFRIELGEIESTLAQHPQVRDAVVLAREDSAESARLVAYVVPVPEQALDLNAIRGFLQATLPDYMIPSVFVPLESLPLTGNGKVDRRALPVPEGRALELHSYSPPRTPVEEIIAGIWARMLNRERVGIHDNFFALGGHSLLATQVVSRIRTALNVDVPLRALFETTTLAELAERVVAAQAEHSGMSMPPLTRVERDRPLPLSFAQQRLWFIEQLQPGTASYHVPAAFTIEGPLDVAALRASLAAVVARHDSLRTRFVLVDATPMQQIEPQLDLPLPVIDLTTLDSDAQSAEVLRLARIEALTPFDLQRGPLLRAILLQLSPATHVLLLTQHHIITDGWSLGILIQDLTAAYLSHRHGAPATLPPLPIQYPDYALWQRQWLSGQVLDQQLGYWQQQLAGLAPLDLPTDRPRPPVQTHRGTTLPIVLDPRLAEQLHALSRANNATLFMTLLAAWQVLLSRYSGQYDIAVGTPIAGRTQAELEHMIGFFVNTLVLRTDLSGNPTVHELIQRVRATTLAAYAHQDAPFEAVVEAVQPERDMSRPPLFQVMFSLMNAPLPEIALPEIQIAPLNVSSSTAMFDLSITLLDLPTGIGGRVEYATDLFDEATIIRLLEHYQILLAGIVADPGQSIAALPLLTEAERQMLLVDRNATALEYRSDRCFHTLVAEQAARTPDALAVVFEDQQLTYRQLDQRANQLAHYLQSLGVGPEVPVVLWLDRSLEQIVALLAILKAGGAYVPLDPSYPAARVAFVAEDTQAPLVVTSSALHARLAGLSARVIELDAVQAQLAPFPTSAPASLVLPENVAYIIYTSGSTGQPKGVMVPHRTVQNLAAGLAQRIYDRIPRRDAPLRVSVNAPLAFDASVQQLLTLMAGHTLYLLSSATRSDVTALLGFLQTQRIDVLDCVPSQLRLLMEAGLLSSGGPAPQVILAGGEAIDLPTWQALAETTQTDVYNMYGPTECTVDTVVARVRDYAALPVIGQPLANTEAYVLDARLEPVPVGVPGELYLGGASVTRGYWRRAALTAERFVPDPFSGRAGARLYRTGDRVRFRADGTIEFLGRMDYQVKLRGFRIELGEIEAALRQHDLVREAVVVLREDRSPASGYVDQRLVAYVVVDQAAQQAGDRAELESRLRQALGTRMPEYMVPGVFVMLDALPLTANGKLDRKALPAPDQARSELAPSYVAPRTPNEEALAKIWAELLRVERVGIHDNFFALGGHSLLAFRLMEQIRKSFGRSLPLATIFERPTIEQLALRLEHDQSARWSPLVPIQPLGSKPPLFCVHGLGGSVLNFLDLGRALAPEQPLYGLQGFGLDDEQEPHATIEEMAAAYVEAIRSIQPQGPYFLSGWSLGGMIAFEMARQLRESGQQIALLAVLDSPLSHDDEMAAQDDGAILMQLAQMYGLRLDDPGILRQLGIEAGVAYLHDQARAQDPDVWGSIPLTVLQRMAQLGIVQTRAAYRYVPQAYAGRISLFYANDNVPDRLQERAEAMRASWVPYADEGVDLLVTPGTHWSMLSQPAVQHLALHLLRLLEQAQQGNLEAYPAVVD